MIEIQEGDRVRVVVNDLGSVVGTVEEIYQNGAGATTAAIDIVGYGIFHQEIGFLTLSLSSVKCKHAGCYASTQAKPGSSFYCPDHLSEIFDEVEPDTPC